MKFFGIAFTFFIFSTAVWAAEAPVQESFEQQTVDEQTSQAPQEVVAETAEKVSRSAALTKWRREKADYFLLGNYSPLDLLLPNKYGITLGAIKSADETWEIEYLHGSASVPFVFKDLGQMTDDRVSVMRRSYAGRNSFNVSYGLSYFDFSLHLGNDILSRVTGGNYPSMDLVKIQSLGVNFALGNRWTFKKNITLGIDWFSWSQPLYNTKKETAFFDQSSNQQDRNDVDTAINVVSRFPRVSFLKIQLGILF